MTWLLSVLVLCLDGILQSLNLQWLDSMIIVHILDNLLHSLHCLPLLICALIQHSVEEVLSHVFQALCSTLSYRCFRF